MKNIEDTLRNYIEGKKDIIAAYLFGSAVTGKDVASSDVDIALLTKPYKDSMESYRSRVSLQTEIARLIGKDVDLVFLQEAGELLAFEILKTGKVIFERDKQAHRSFRALRLIQSLDFLFLEKQMQRGMIAAMKRGKIGQ